MGVGFGIEILTVATFAHVDDKTIYQEYFFYDPWSERGKFGHV
jgi:hypothetical protein